MSNKDRGGDAMRQLVVGPETVRMLADKVHLRLAGCLGFCEIEPMVILKAQDILYPRVEPKDGAELVGQAAKRQAITNSENTVYSVKRFMGRRMDEVSEEMTMVPYKVVRAKNGDARIAIRGKEYSPPEISAFISRTRALGRLICCLCPGRRR